MHTIYLILLAALLIFIGIMIIRVIRGPSVYDRMNGLSVIGADVVIILVLFGFLDGRPEMFIDIAIAYGILGFVTNLIISKYLGGKK